MLPFREPGLHTPDRTAGVPEHVVLRADKQEMPVDVLHLDSSLFPDRMAALAFLKYPD